MSSTNGKTMTEVVPASKLKKKVLETIFITRYPEQLEEYKAALASYKKAKGKREEGEFEITEQSGFFSSRRKTKGFISTTVPKDDSVSWQKWEDKILVYAPKAPSFNPYHYNEYSRYSGFTSHAKNLGLLAGSRFNREISNRRVDEYAEAMKEGLWRDLLSDPITITIEGEVINGQHRLAASSKVDWSKVDNDPLFLIVWGVDPQEAMHADLSRRTPKDQTTIVSKVAGELIPPKPAIDEEGILEAGVGVMSAA